MPRTRRTLPSQGGSSVEYDILGCHAKFCAAWAAGVAAAAAAGWNSESVQFAASLNLKCTNRDPIMMPLLQVQVHWHTPASIAYIVAKVALGSEAQGCQWARGRQKGTGTAGSVKPPAMY